MTPNEIKCGEGEITIDGVTTNVDFTVDISANPINRLISARSHWRPPIFNGCIHSIPERTFEVLKTHSHKFCIKGEVQNGTTIICDDCSAFCIEDFYEKRGDCISCNISFDAGDFYFEYLAESGADKE